MPTEGKTTQEQGTSVEGGEPGENYNETKNEDSLLESTSNKPDDPTPKGQPGSKDMKNGKILLDLIMKLMKIILEESNKYQTKKGMSPQPEPINNEYLRKVNDLLTNFFSQQRFAQGPNHKQNIAKQPENLIVLLAKFIEQIELMANSSNPEKNITNSPPMQLEVMGNTSSNIAPAVDDISGSAGGAAPGGIEGEHGETQEIEGEPEIEEEPTHETGSPEGQKM